MKVLIRANPSPGHDHAWRADRRWGTDPVEVEVLSQDEDPPKLKEIVKVDGKDVVRQYSDPHRIGRKSLEMIKADSRLSILSDEQTKGALNQRAVDAARKAAADAGAKAADLEVQLQTAHARIAELEAELAAAKDQAGPGGGGTTGPGGEGTAPEGGAQTADEGDEDVDGEEEDGDETQLTEGETEVTEGGTRRRTPRRRR